MKSMILEISPFVMQQTVTILDGDKVLEKENVPSPVVGQFYEWIIHKAYQAEVETIEILSSDEAFTELDRGIKESEQKLYSVNKLTVEHI